MKMKLALWGIGVAAAVVVLIAITAKVVIARCANDFSCISQYQYYYLTTMNNAISGYAGDIFSCSASNTPQGAEFLMAEDISTNQLTCRKIDKSNEGIITKVIQASALQNNN